MANRIQLRRDSQSNWESINPILADGEPGLNYDNNKIKVGNGSDNWTSLSYATGIPTLSYNDLNDKPFIPASITDLISSGGSNARQFLRYNGGTGQIEFSSDFRVVPSSGVVYPGGTIGTDKVGDVAFSQGTTYYCYQEPNAYTISYAGSNNWVPEGWLRINSIGTSSTPPQVGDKVTDGTDVSTITSIEAPWQIQYADVRFMLINISPARSSWKNGAGDLIVYTGSEPHLNCWARIGSDVAAAPAHNTSNGIAGQIAYDDNYIYRCVQSNLPQITAGVYATPASVSGNNQTNGSNTVNVLDANGVVAPQNGWTVSDGSNQRTITNVNRQNSAWGYIYTLTLNNTIDWSAPTSLTILSQLSQSGVWKRTALNADTW
jgi:hypothetical protein